MLFEVTFRKQNGEYASIDVSAPTKLDAWINFMSEHSGKKWEIASVKRTKKKKERPVPKFVKKLVSFTISPMEYIVFD